MKIGEPFSAHNIFIGSLQNNEINFSQSEISIMENIYGRIYKLENQEYLAMFNEKPTKTIKKIVSNIKDNEEKKAFFNEIIWDILDDCYGKVSFMVGNSNPKVLKLSEEHKYYCAMEEYYQELKQKLKVLNRKIGCYLLFDINKKIIYVGKSVNLKDRVLTSIKDKNAYYFQYVTVSNVMFADNLEIALINANNPPKNINFPLMSYERALEIMDNTPKTEISDIIKCFSYDYSNGLQI